jgi:hypothetical protein
LNVPNVSDVRQIEIHTAEPLLPGPSYLEVDIAIAKLKNYKLPGSDQILEGLIQAGGETLLSVIHKLLNSICNMDQCKESVIVPIKKQGDIVQYHCNQLHTKSY